MTDLKKGDVVKYSYTTRESSDLEPLIGIGIVMHSVNADNAMNITYGPFVDILVQPEFSDVRVPIKSVEKVKDLNIFHMILERI